MFKKSTMAFAAAALSLPYAAQAQSQDELQTLRDRVKQLEQRVDEAEQAAIQASNRPTAENALNPGVSAILNGVYSNLSQDPKTFRVNGFVPTNGEVSPEIGRASC